MVSPSELLSRAEGENLGDLAQRGIGGTLLAIATAMISGVLSLSDLVTEPIDGAAGGLRTLTEAIFGGPAEILWAGVDSTVAAIQGSWGLGPFSFAMALGAILLAFWVLGRFRSEEETGNLIPGLPFDVPFIGQDEEGE